MKLHFRGLDKFIKFKKVYSNQVTQDLLQREQKQRDQLLQRLVEKKVLRPHPILENVLKEQKRKRNTESSSQTEKS